MNSNKNIIIILICMLYSFMYITSAYAQTKEQLILLDEASKLPIQGAIYEYGPQLGISDDHGKISFTLIEGEVMRLSHLNYGSWVWDEQALREVLKQNIYYRKSLIMSLYPVTVIAIKPHEKLNEKMEIDYQDRMEHDAAAILNQIPVISSIKKSGSYGFDPVLRGFKYDQLNIVMNGAQSATAACPNRMDPPTSQMAPNMMDRIEIFKGPYALRYGVGIGGTINFVPSKIQFSEKSDLYGRISSEYQSNKNVLRSEGQIGWKGEKYNLSFFGAWSQGDDYKTGNGETVLSDFQRGSFGTNLGLKLSSNQQLKISALFNLARDVDFPALAMDLRNDDTWIFSVGHEIIFSEKYLKSWNTTLFGSFVDHLMDNRLKELDPRMLNAATNAKTFNYGGRTEGLWYFPKGKLFAGLDFRMEGAEGTRVRAFLLGPNAGRTFFDNAWQKGQISKTGLFAEYHLDTKPLKYVFSGRLEVNNANINDPSTEFTAVAPNPNGTQVNPSLSVGIIKKFSPHVQSGIWLARTQRSGSLTEKFINYFSVGQDAYEMLGNPDLNPEINNQIDLTFEWANEKSALNVDVFAAYLQGNISSVIDTSLTPRLPTSPGVRRFINLDKAVKTGFEVNWKQKLVFGLQHQTGVAYTLGQNLDEDEPIPEIAPLSFRYTLQGDYLKGKLQPEATFRYVMEQTRISENFGETITPAFKLLDIQLTYSISEQIRFGAGVNNLLDEAYYQHLNRATRGTDHPILERGRNFFTSISINFN